MTGILPWVIFASILLFVIFCDLFAFRRKPKAIPLKEALFRSAVWISLALLFNVFVYYSRGGQAAIDFFTSYLVEKSLSVDNLFVFMMIFKYFETPERHMYKVLFWGILGAIVMRGLFIWLGLALIGKFHWILYILGIFLIYSGIKFWQERGKKISPEKNPVLKLFRKLFRVTETYENDQFFLVKRAKLWATPLFVVLIAIEFTDIIFAIDSIPAVFAITTDPFVVYTSNIFAILGIKSLYFVLSHFMKLFHYLHYGLAAILVFIGTKMLIADYFRINNLAALAVVLAILTVTAIASMKSLSAK